MSNKTIKELADELNVSKQAIRKHLDKLPPTLSVTKENGKILMNVAVVKFVKDRTNRVTGNNTSNQKEKVTDNIELLNEYVFELKEQIKQKDKQIEQAHKLIENQQILTLQANKKIEQLEYQSDEKERSVSQPETLEKKSWFKKWFK
ncbi:DUF536 domain-containing protein [Brochothrix thermosphacta]|uniref:DUF536 domain-containing protein n=1 Tax=Brochothrix thermosphacta TaxID=2756 RepID=UPI002712FE80|nr:DUF536 domain-containing protein [Brochothrix thermosphacta]MDO7865188.1 DUF536 domain-containing protein [Brochothrix thermosphacta]